MKTKDLVLTIGCFLWVVLLYSQSQKSTHFGWSFAPQYAAPVFEKPELGEIENTFSFQFRLDGYFDLSPRFRFNPGVSFNTFQIQQIDYSPIFGCDIDPSTGIDQFNSWVEDRFTVNYIGIPLEVQFKLLGDQHYLYIKAGGAYFFKIRESSRTSVLMECGTNELVLRGNPFNELRRSILLITAGLGYNHRLSKRIQLFLEPEWAYTLNSINVEQSFAAGGDATNNVKVFQYGLRLGLVF